MNECLFPITKISATCKIALGGRLKKLLQGSLPLIYLQSIKCHSFGISEIGILQIKITISDLMRAITIIIDLVVFLLNYS